MARLTGQLTNRERFQKSKEMSLEAGTLKEHADSYSIVPQNRQDLVVRTCTLQSKNT